jgi:superfamily II DNA or RNA helicase
MKNNDIQPEIPDNHLQSIDFLRNCFVYSPAPSHKSHAPFLIASQSKKQRVFCSCTKGSYAQCAPSLKLLELHSQLTSSLKALSPQENFNKSIFWKIFEPITKFSTTSCNHIKSESIDNTLLITDSSGNDILICYGMPDEQQRLLSRTGQNSSDTVYFRLNKALELVYSENEKAMKAAGHKTQFQAVEESVWYRVAYHCFREYDSIPLSIAYEIDHNKNRLALIFASQDTVLMKIFVPSKAVFNCLNILSGVNLPGKRLKIEHEEAELMFRITENSEGKIACTPAIRDPRNSGSPLVTLREQALLDSLVYMPKLNAIFRVSRQTMGLLATGWNKERIIEKDSFSRFLTDNEQAFMLETGQATDNASQVIDLFAGSGGTSFGRLADPPVVNKFDRIEISPVSLDNNRCIMTVTYRNGSFTVPLKQLIDSRKSRSRFIFNRDFIVDCESEGVSSAIVSSRGFGSDGTVELSRADLLQFRGTTLSANITGEKRLVNKIKKMLEFKPARDLEPFQSLKCELREYQRLGVQWLLFLYDNNFGGLLCDDMGLGKTVQIIAFIEALKEQRNCTEPVIALCPATVLPHWHKIISAFAPDLKVKVYYNSGRENALKKDYDVLLTTYGILRNDIEELGKTAFELAVFDEVHQLKNDNTETYNAAARINSRCSIGLTGTPIENSLNDLKNLFNLTMPGLFGHDTSAGEQIVSLLESASDNHLQHLHKLISPFILRRTKKMVLLDLPPKIEDFRTCELTEEQRTIYFEAMTNRGGPIIQSLKNRDAPVPYMKILALLSFLKQVCDHPALAAGRPSEYESHNSGKWELFTELLDEALESGQKVVVFTQFLGMVEIFHLYLEQKNIGHCVLTGESRNRGDLIKRFETDDTCRVFIGSLKAGGVGIDLVAASVVIHYDRWWNASKEDQATDRVHRIGQKRGVQVLKLVTEKSIEERIGNIIDRKKKLAEKALIEDDPEELKVFTREELMEIIGGV